MPLPSRVSPSMAPHAASPSPAKPASATSFFDLHRIAGNRSVGALLRLGAPGDAAERRADAAADAVMARLGGKALPPPALAPEGAAGVIRRDGGAGGGGVSAGQAQQIAAAAKGGRPIEGAARGALERGFGRSLSAMRVHDGPEAASLSRAFGARAFSVGSHLFFGEGRYRPETAAGRRLLSHEVAHGLEGEDGVVRRTYLDAPLGKYYSHALAGQVVDKDTAVATVTGSQSTFHGGHAFVYLEYLDEDESTHAKAPYTLKVELRAGGGTLSGSGGSGSSKGTVHGSAASQGHSSGWSGSGSDSAKGLRIEMGDASDKDKGYLETAGRKRSWVVSHAAMDKIVAKAKDVAANIDDYTYKLVGRSMFALKKTVNCARFAEKILKAGGIAASAGWMLKTTSGLTDGADVGYTKDADFAAVETQRAEAAARQREQQRLREEQEAQAAAQRQARFALVPTGKLRATWDPAATTLLAGPSASGAMQPYTLVAALTGGPLEIERSSMFVVTEQTKGQGIALLRGQASDAGGHTVSALDVDLDDLVTKSTALA